MAKRTWKIGEMCKGGVITTEFKNDKIVVIGKDWDFSAGSKKSSNQSNAKEFTRISFDMNKEMVNFDSIRLFLNNLTSCYYADMILNWIEDKINS